jgi:hypothetical protein
MTINNSGGVMKYDGQPMPSKTANSSDDTLDTIVFNEFEMPIRRDISAANYTAIVLASNYPIQKT